ncbi:DNAJ heat shock N-terminal domain-containing protein [Halteromyces radiatus]|uniref:DNAJ heat shock N-terminal domain-containing protein n=1 Tax=Halteromyces radiatus TaxID=101107 RepID=UPI002221027A|nr:DNAJ heat shock N-terminal domain-containing protein [Halteromyces radiatus]KAI8092746.1 DNAJ heat shock N-terminal domain-containing protein [Halteromyces radiatus]
METHYEVLGVAKDAPVSIIKQRFQQLIIEHHPDKRNNLPLSTSDQDYAHRILQAWAVLRNEEKRKLYDHELEVATQRQKVTINADVDLDDMEYDESNRIFSLICRCSGSYVISEEDLEQGNDVICCDNCSLRIRVLYDIIDDDDDE